MRENDIIANVVRYYERKLECFGATARGVDWKDEASQAKRFEQLGRALGLEERGRFSLLDFGCGYGALLSHLCRLGLDVDYTGYDPSQCMVDQAKAAHPGAAFTTDWSAVPAADYVVASGVFNVRLDTPSDQWSDYVVHELRKLDSKARHGWAVNFLTSHSDADRKRADLFYADPGFFLDWCLRSASRWVFLLHDYDLYEFTIGVRRHPH
jgi:SAM-dependent methyltransferase